MIQQQVEELPEFACLSGFTSVSYSVKYAIAAVVPQAWSLAAALLLLTAAAAAGDVTADSDVTEELLASALKDAAEHWELDSLRYDLSDCELSC